MAFQTATQTLQSKNFVRREIRKIGIKKTLLGVVITVGTGIFLVISGPEITNYDPSKFSVSRYGSGGSAVLILIGGYFGLSRLFDGIIHLVRPQSVDKSLS